MYLTYVHLGGIKRIYCLEFMKHPKFTPGGGVYGPLLDISEPRNQSSRSFLDRPRRYINTDGAFQKHEVTNHNPLDLCECHSELLSRELLSPFDREEGGGILGAFAKLRKSTNGFIICPSAWNNSTPKRRIFTKLGILVSVEEIQVSLKSEKN